MIKQSFSWEVVVVVVVVVVVFVLVLVVVVVSGQRMMYDNS